MVGSLMQTDANDDDHHGNQTSSPSGDSGSGGGVTGMGMYEFHWRVTRHVRTIGNILVRFRYEGALTGFDEPSRDPVHYLQDLCPVEADLFDATDEHAHEHTDAGPDAHETGQAVEGGIDAGVREGSTSPTFSASSEQFAPPFSTAPPPPRVHLPCEALAFNVSANFHVVIESKLVEIGGQEYGNSEDVGEAEVLKVPLGARLSLTFRVFERSSQTEVQPWGEDAARVFLYIFQENESAAGSEGEVGRGAEQKEPDEVTPLLVVEARESPVARKSKALVPDGLVGAGGERKGMTQVRRGETGHMIGHDAGETMRQATPPLRADDSRNRGKVKAATGSDGGGFLVSWYARYMYTGGVLYQLLLIHADVNGIENANARVPASMHLRTGPYKRIDPHRLAHKRRAALTRTHTIAGPLAPTHWRAGCLRV